MSAATFLGLTGLAFIGGSDAAIFTIGVTVSWAFLLFVFADRMRNLGRFTFADIVAFRLQPERMRVLAAAGHADCRNSVSHRADGRRGTAD